MFKILTIAKREYAAMVATKAFAFTLVMMPVLMLGGIVLMPMLGKLSGSKERRIVVADGTGKLFGVIRAAADEYNERLQASAATSDDGDGAGDGAGMFTRDYWNFEAADSATLDDQTRLDLSREIRDGQLYAFVEIPVDLLPSDGAVSVTPVTFVSQDSAISPARSWLQHVLLSERRSRRLDAAGIDQSLVAAANQPVRVEAASLFKKSDGKAAGGGDADAIAQMLLPFGLMMLQFLVIFLAAQPMLESAMEEKSQRIAELLLGSVSSTALMAGKLLGNVAGSLVVFAVYAIGTVTIAWYNAWSIEIPWELLPWFLVFQILGVLFFSSIFMTIGASVSELKEAQSMLLPVWLFICSPMMVWFLVVRDANSALAVALSFFPPATPLMMTLRLGTGQAIPAWQTASAAIVLAAATVGVVLIAGRIYRASLLRGDSASSFRQLVKRFATA